MQSVQNPANQSTADTYHKGQNRYENCANQQVKEIKIDVVALLLWFGDRRRHAH
jgi:hypothetical protein